MDLALIQEAARQLREARETRVPIDPIRDLVGTETDLEVGYAIQQINTDLDIAAGRRVSGRKIGLTAEVVQQQFGVDQPDFGTLFADMCLADGIDLPPDRLIQPRAEVEVAIVLDDDLDKGEHCVVDVMNAVAYVVPALEIVDSRIRDWDIKFVDTVADNGSSAMYVVGTRPTKLADVDLRDVPMRLEQNGEITSTGIGSACLGHPLHAAVWLADVMSQRGTPLLAGQCVMTGAVGPMVSMAPGDEVVADMGPLGTVSTTLRKA